MNIFFWKKNVDNDTERRNRLLELEVAGLRRRERRPIRIIDAAVAEPAPTDDTAREAYVSSFARFYQDFLQKKLEHLIAQVREDLDWSGWKDYAHPDGMPTGMKRSEYDAYLRGTSNAFKLLMEYGEQCVNEAEAYKIRQKQ